MNKALIGVLIAIATLTGCNGDGAYVNAELANPSDTYNVRKLFTVDGCDVYRFSDNRYVYFTNCQGSTSWSNNEGKAVTDYQNTTKVK